MLTRATPPAGKGRSCGRAVLYLCAFIGGFGAACTADAAQIEIASSATELPLIKLQGEIDARTPGSLESALNFVQPQLSQTIKDTEGRYPIWKGKLGEIWGAQLSIDSDGGDVEAAMKCGEIARKYHLSISVPRNASCASACVFLLVGGSSRLVVGRIGIHRPYSTGYSQSLSESEQRYKTLNAAVAQYFGAMNMTPRLIEAMNAVPSDEIRWLTKDEMNAMGLGVPDPIWQDRSDSLWAERYGVTKQEYYRRKQMAVSRCEVFVAVNAAHQRCQEDVMMTGN
jgi:ATP-dependent protease ClpP protease subunit